MKKFLGIALVLALALSSAVYAESNDAVMEPVPAVEAAAPTGAEASAEEDASSDQTALKDAMDAYRAARQQKAVDDLEAELAGYVAAGTMTQAQADLILKSVKERQAAGNGQCPNCGYQFQNKGGRMGGMQRGQQRGNQMPGSQQQSPDAQSGATPRQSGGMQRGQMMPQQPNGQVPQMPQR